MSVQGVSPNLEALLSSSAPLLRLQSDSTLQQTLQIGQVIEAKVLRVYQGGRYLAELGGQERVIDSSIPLQQGQVLRARVLAMDEQVVLERLHGSGQSQTRAWSQQEGLAAPAWLQQPGGAQALALFAQYGNLLSEAQWQSLQAPARSLGASATVLAGLLLARLGLSLDASLLRALTQALAGNSQLRSGQAVLAAATQSQAAASDWQAVATAAATASAKAAATASIAADPGQSTQDPAQLLAQMVSAELVRSQARLLQDDDPGADTAWDDPRRDADLARAMATTVLNAAQDSALTQRVLSLPLMVDGRLLELRLALFDDSEQAVAQPELKQRVLRIALDLDSLGRVELQARLVNRHISLEWRADSESMATLAGRHDAALAHDLAEHGFTLDSARYVAASRDEGGAMHEVMARVIAGGAFSLVA